MFDNLERITIDGVKDVPVQFVGGIVTKVPEGMENSLSVGDPAVLSIIVDHGDRPRLYVDFLCKEPFQMMSGLRFNRFKAWTIIHVTNDGLDVTVQNGRTTDILLHKIQVMAEYERMASDE